MLYSGPSLFVLFLLSLFSLLAAQTVFIEETKTNEEIEAACGPHPLQSILDKLALKQPQARHEDLVKVLAVLRVKAPRIWKNYESALSVYTNCKLMASSGSLG